MPKEEIKENEVKEAKKPTRIINLGYVNAEETMIVNTDDSRISKVVINGTAFEIEVIYDEGRGMYRAAFIQEGSRTSLSFFNNKLVAYKSALLSVCSMVGLTLKNINVTL